MTRAVVAIVMTVLLQAAAAAGQDVQPLRDGVDREIVAGAVHAYTILLNAGDLVTGSIEQRGTVILAAAYLPDGTRLRGFPGPREGKRQFAFVAEQAGTYRLELTVADVPSSSTGAQTAAGGYKLNVSGRRSLDERLSTPPPAAKHRSPAIETLRQQIATGDRDTEGFWRRIAASGTPLVEPIESDAQHTLVTFLWRGAVETRHVGVFGSFVTGPPADYVMTRLGASDVWYLTVRLPSGARFAYGLLPNGPLTFDETRAAEMAASMQGDPLNPNRWACPPTATRWECQSMVELPGAPPQPWLAPRPESAAGKVEKHTIKSEILKNERGLSVYTPANYRSGGPPAALLVLFDEGAYLTNPVPTPIILDNLIAAGKIPPTVAVLIANPSQDSRNKELPPNPQFAEFLATELMPWVRAHYTVTDDPKLTVVAGSSFGGIAATYAGLRHSEIFGNVLCQSGSFWWAPDHVGPGIDATTETGWLAKEFIKTRKLPLKFWMDAGVFEVDSRGMGGAILEPSRHMRDVLLAKGYEVEYHQFNSGHDYLTWRGTLADGLIALIGVSGASSR